MSTLYYLPQKKTTTLATVGGINASQTADIKLNNVDNVDTTKPGIICMSWSDPIVETAYEYISYTSIDGSNILVGATRGAESSTGRTHSNGATVAWVYSKSHINNLNDDYKVEHNEDGTHKYDGTIPLYNNSFFRQALINGNFDVWQRGTSVVPSDSTATYLADRWFEYVYRDGGNLPTLTRSRQILTAEEIVNSYYFSRLTTNGSGSGFGAGSYHACGQRIEHGTRFLAGAGRKVTVSFYARSSISNKKLGIYLVQRYGTGGSPASEEIITGTNWTLTSSWTKYTYTFTTNTLVGKTFGTNNDDHLQPTFMFMWGSNIASRVGASSSETYVGSGNVDIAQVQLCAGEVALPFQPKSFEEELRACQRYAEKLELSADGSFLGIRQLTSDQTARFYWFFKVKKRSTPILGGNTISTSLGTGSNQIKFFNTTTWAEITHVGNITLTMNVASKDGASLSLLAGTSMSGTTGQILEWHQASDVVIIAGAEL